MSARQLGDVDPGVGDLAPAVPPLPAFSDASWKNRPTILEHTVCKCRFRSAAANHFLFARAKPQAQATRHGRCWHQRGDCGHRSRKFSNPVGALRP